MAILLSAPGLGQHQGITSAAGSTPGTWSQERLFCRGPYVEFYGLPVERGSFLLDTYSQIIWLQEGFGRILNREIQNSDSGTPTLRFNHFHQNAS